MAAYLNLHVHNITLEIVKNGWFQRLCVKGITEVCGSVSQCSEPTAVQIETNTSKTATKVQPLVMFCVKMVTSI